VGAHQPRRGRRARRAGDELSRGAALPDGHPRRAAGDDPGAPRHRQEHAGLDLERFLGQLEAAAGARLDRDDERDLADALVMSWDQVRALKAAGMDVQTHSHAHRVLQTISDEEVTADLRTSRSLLEAQLEAPVFALAYPAGKPIDAHPGLRRAVRRAGIRLGLTTAPGSVRLERSLDWLGIPRVTVERDMSEPFFRGCLAFPALAYG
jgi:hypothetical protein